MTIQCPRCDGSGIYTGHGKCFRCKGRKTVNAAAPRAERAPKIHTKAEMIEKVGLELTEAAAAYDWSR